MNYVADFHIHSRFSRATSKTLDFENLYIAAQKKGITVVGTGDFTHPGWFSEIKEKLVPSEEGLFQLREDIAKQINEAVPDACRGTVRFILATEISNIYKKKEKTRKNHNLVFVPNLDIAARLNSTLDAIGNISSDGRPILGLDARDLLEIVLEISEQAFLIPAHIWTPWFSLLGSKSGFDSVRECFEDLTDNIFAVETGLSSDPAMNRRVSELDGFTLVSNSDAHSPLNLGREANLLNTDLSYDSIKRAIKSGDPGQFLGTIEFYPEEGKYHFDGHRKCQICFHPETSIKNNGICPVCRKPLTLGVLYRVEMLADRSEPEKTEKYPPFHSLIPLTEILSELMQVGPKSKKVSQKYSALLKQLGPEFQILQILPIDTIKQAGIPLLDEAIDRMRRREVLITPGFDGEYGKITLFRPEERELLLGQKGLFEAEKSNQSETEHKQSPLFPLRPEKPAAVINNFSASSDERVLLNDEQRNAVEHSRGPVLVVAGPGTGKTRTLTHRIAYLISDRGISSENILAVTFTNKAAREMQDRLTALLGQNIPLPLVATFHSFCLKILAELNDGKTPAILDDRGRKALIKEAVKQIRETGIQISASYNDISDLIVSAKQQFLSPADALEIATTRIKTTELQAVYSTYQNLLAVEGLCDFEDLIFKVVIHFKKKPIPLKGYQNRFKYIFVDEYQDLNLGQYRLVKALSPPKKDLFVIGDPDQSIYGFRGSDVVYFQRFLEDYPEARVIQLTRNYRSSKTILNASYQVIKNHKLSAPEVRIYSDIESVKRIGILEHSSEKAEAVAVGKTIENVVGGTGFYSIDFGSVNTADQTTARSFSDIAVFFRTAAQGEVFAQIFDAGGIPYQMVSKRTLFYQDGMIELLTLLRVVEGVGSYADLDILMPLKGNGVGKRALDILKSWGYKNRFTITQALWHAKRIPVPGMAKGSQKSLYEFILWLDRMKKSTEGLPVKASLLHLSEIMEIKPLITKDPKSEAAFTRLLTISERFGHRTTDFLAAAALQSDTDTYDDQAEKVSLMTLHAAKGLEFPVVFIVGCEAGYIPHHRSHTDPDEERRLFYVAMTRAKEQLYLTWAKYRRIYGKRVSRTLSPFVTDIEQKLRSHETASKKRPKQEDQVQLKLF